MAIHVTPIPRLTALTTPAFTLGTSNAAGDALTAVSSNSTLLTYDTTDPAAVATSAVVGSATTAARRDHVHVGGPAATQAQMEAASANTVFATPGRTQNHPGVAKGWAYIDGATTPAAIILSYGTNDFEDDAVGQYTVHWATDFSSDNYCVTFGPQLNAVLQEGHTAAISAGETEITAKNESFAEADCNRIFIAVHGIQV